MSNAVDERLVKTLSFLFHEAVIRFEEAVKEGDAERATRFRSAIIEAYGSAMETYTVLKQELRERENENAS
jgi:hypothetical protein